MGRPPTLREVLENFRKENPAEITGALFEELQNLVDADVRERRATEPILEVDHLVRLASEQLRRGDQAAFLDQKAARRAYVDLFRHLGERHWGRLIVGRRGHPTRFVFRWDRDRGLHGLLVHLRERGVDRARDDDRDGPRPASSAPSKDEPVERDAVVAKLRAHWPRLRAFGVTSLDLFGSLARGEATAESDIDLLVGFEGPLTSDAFFGAKFFLEDLLERRIDFVTRSTLREPIRRAIEPDLVHVA